MNNLYVYKSPSASVFTLQVGFFPYECVELIGDKIPASVVSNIPETPSAKACKFSFTSLQLYSR